jgi:hypothetical protein
MSEIAGAIVFILGPMLINAIVLINMNAILIIQLHPRDTEALG